MLAPRCWVAALLLAAIAGSSSATAQEPAKLTLKKNDRLVFVGGTLAERMQYFGNFETLLYSRFPDLELVVRDLGWSGDELTLRPRSKDFKDHGHMLADHKPTVIVAFFGFNESFAGPDGLAKFEADVTSFLKTPQGIDQYSSARGNWDHNADAKIDTKAVDGLRQIVLVSPIAHENIKRAGYPDGAKNNANLKLYTEALAKVAKANGAVFVDLFTPSLQKMQAAQKPLTINGIHLNAAGDEVVAQILDQTLFGARPSASCDMAKLKAEVQEKNLQFFYDYRAVNGFYIYGDRKKPFGVVNFPHEFAKLRKMVANRDQRIWAVAAGKTVSEVIDDSNTGEMPPTQTNMKGQVKLISPAESLKTFKLPEGYQANLFASEVEFPDLEKPVQLCFDNKGRMVVCCMPSYPQYVPGVPVNDKILILEDTNGDGQADKRTVFADKLYLPTGIEIGDKGVYVAQQPNLLHLRDTDGDDKADVRENVLHGFDSADSHHSISAFTWDNGGALYFQEGTFHHTQVETPYGPERCVNAGVYRWEPRTGKFDVFVSYSFANPWGHYVDKWGQNFVADASGGDNYFGAAFSGDVDYPHKHGGLKKFLVKQWRPTSGCELVSSRNFPAEAQGNYLLNNCIGFQGVLQYKVKDEGSGIAADPVEPLLTSSDPNFRPVDLEFGPDGALYIIDWFNPLIGHMQHSIRDPNRDKTHGRIWRITYTKNPLVKPAKIAGEPVPALLDLLKTYEDRTRYRARLELRDRDTAEVTAAVDKWVAGLDKNDAEYQRLLCEALWVKQHHDAVDVALLKQLLRSPKPEARAAATRVLCYWRDRVEQPLELLRAQVNDEHPRVRLEAIRALSFFEGQQAAVALDVVAESFLHPDDDYIKYVVKETTNTLERRAKAVKK